MNMELKNHPYNWTGNSFEHIWTKPPLFFKVPCSFSILGSILIFQGIGPIVVQLSHFDFPKRMPGGTVRDLLCQGPGIARASELGIKSRNRWWGGSKKKGQLERVPPMDWKFNHVCPYSNDFFESCFFFVKCQSRFWTEHSGNGSVPMSSTEEGLLWKFGDEIFTTWPWNGSRGGSLISNPHL